MPPDTLNIIFEAVENVLEPLELTLLAVRKKQKLHFLLRIRKIRCAAKSVNSSGSKKVSTASKMMF